MRVADNKTQLRVADPAVAYRNGRQNARLEWGSSNIYGFTYFCGVLPKNFHFLQVLAKKSAGVSWRGVLGSPESFYKHFLIAVPGDNKPPPSPHGGAWVHVKAPTYFIVPTIVPRFSVFSS